MFSKRHPARVLVVESQRIFRNALARALEAEGDLMVVGFADESIDARTVRATTPDVIVVESACAPTVREAIRAARRVTTTAVCEIDPRRGEPADVRRTVRAALAPRPAVPPPGVPERRGTGLPFVGEDRRRRG